MRPWRALASQVFGGPLEDPVAHSRPARSALRVERHAGAPSEQRSAAAVRQPVQGGQGGPVDVLAGLHLVIAASQRPGETPEAVGDGFALGADRKEDAEEGAVKA